MARIKDFYFDEISLMDSPTEPNGYDEEYREKDMSDIKIEAGRTTRLIKLNVTTQDLSIMQTLYLEKHEAERLKDELTAYLQEIDGYERELQTEAEKYMEEA